MVVLLTYLKNACFFSTNKAADLVAPIDKALNEHISQLVAEGVTGVGEVLGHFHLMVQEMSRRKNLPDPRGVGYSLCRGGR